METVLLHTLPEVLGAAGCAFSASPPAELVERDVVVGPQFRCCAQLERCRQPSNTATENCDALRSIVCHFGTLRTGYVPTLKQLTVGLPRISSPLTSARHQSSG
jgi:hypothetical protein